MKFKLLILAVIAFIACNNETKVAEDAKIVKEPPRPAIIIKNLIDTLKYGYDLNRNQLDKLIGDEEYLSENVHGKGLKVYNLFDSLLVVILQFSDGMVCTNELLITLLPKNNEKIDIKEIQNNCDFDLSNENYRTTYRFENDSVFSLIDETYNKGEENADPHKTELSTWQIRNDGKIIALQK